MAHRVLVTFEFDAEDLAQVSDAIDDAVGAIADVISQEPMVGLEVDGTHREPDDPYSQLDG